MLTALTFLIPLGLFLRWPSCLWNFDGVACAAALELGNPLFYFHADHLIYAFLGFGFWKGLAIHVGFSRALPALQLYTSLLSATALLGISIALRRLDVRPLLATLVTAAVAVTAVVWVWSIEAQVYPLGLIGLAFATATLWNEPQHKNYRWTGIWHAVAILGHVMNLLWWVPFWYWTTRDARISASERAVLRKTHAIWTLGLTGGAYLCVIIFVVLPRHSFRWMLTWLKGSAGLTPDRTFSWHLGTWVAPWEWLRSSFYFFWGGLHPYNALPVSNVVGALTVVSMGVTVFLLARSWRERTDPAWAFSLIWIGVYGLFLWSWEPATLCYRMTDAIPVAVLLALGLKSLAISWRRYALVGTLIVTTGFSNWLTLVKPMSDASRNALYVQTISLAQHTPDNAIYLMGSGSPWIYLLYFTGRSAWNVQSPTAEPAFESRQQRPVFSQAGLLTDPSLPEWLKHNRWTPLASDASWMEMQ